jgi:DNA-binding NtrC family response regulator/tetratricopeptide (TPR) repeat protein
MKVSGVTISDTCPRSRNAQLEVRPQRLIESSETLLDNGHFERAATLAAEAVLVADKTREPVVRAAARRLLAIAHLNTDRMASAIATAQEGVRIAQGAKAYAELAMCELALSEIARSGGDDAGGLRHATRARVVASKAHDDSVLRAVLAEIGWLLTRVGDVERGREAFAEALAMADVGASPARAFRVYYNSSRAARASGRIGEALQMLDRAEVLAQSGDLQGALWSVTTTRTLALLDVGAVDEARVVLEAHKLSSEAPKWQRAQQLMLRASVATAAGERPDAIMAVVTAGLELASDHALTRHSLERLRVAALLARGQKDEAERVAVALVSESARGGARPVVAAAMALAARAAVHPQAALLRWLGAHALASGGVAARTEHEALAALTNSPDPIGKLSRDALTVIRARLVDRTPPHLRATATRTLKQVEQGLSAETHRPGTQIALDPQTAHTKEAVGIVGRSPGLLRAVATVSRASRNASSIVLIGETGSGKELFARLAHELSPRRAGPFVAINCAAIPEPLLEAELFGHERGAFTGADRARQGLFVEADGGTLFLDELGEMSAAMQAKLLRVLEDREVRALGGTKVRKVDVRVVAATHRDLLSLIAGKQFREDLYYRIAGWTVRVPPLRERPEDVPAIARALLHRDPSTRGYRIDVPGLTALAEYSWPGNVRELANVMHLAAALAEDEVVGGNEVRQAIGERTQRATRDVASTVVETTIEQLRARHRSEVRELVGRAIAAADGNKRAAARTLGISRQGLYRLVEEN